MGKGSKRRSEDRAAFEANYERTFAKKEPLPKKFDLDGSVFRCNDPSCPFGCVDVGPLYTQERFK